MSEFNRCILGDCRDVMRQLIADGVRVQTIVTSPPYFSLRDYGVAGQIGLESTLQEFIAKMVEVFDVARELLADDGTLWVNLGDSYNAAGREGHGTRQGFKQGTNRASYAGADNCRPSVQTLKQKDLCGVPWRVAFALQDAGWYLRQDIIWSKPNPMPESVRDRCTKAHEYLFLLTKRERYYFDQDAIKESAVSFGDYKMPDGWDTGKGGHGSFHRNGREKGRTPGNINPPKGQAAYEAGDERHRTKAGLLAYAERSRRDSFKRVTKESAVPGQSVLQHREERAESAYDVTKRNKRSVWTIATESYSEAHFATFPQALVEPCILAGSRPGDIVFDPFMGSGTVAQVAQRLGRRWLGAELNPAYIELQRGRVQQFGLELHSTEQSA